MAATPLMRSEAGPRDDRGAASTCPRTLRTDCKRLGGLRKTLATAVLSWVNVLAWRRPGPPAAPVRLGVNRENPGGLFRASGRFRQSGVVSGGPLWDASLGGFRFVSGRGEVRRLKRPHPSGRLGVVPASSGGRVFVVPSRGLRRAAGGCPPWRKGLDPEGCRLDSARGWEYAALHPGRQPQNCQRSLHVVWGAPHENPGLQPKNCRRNLHVVWGSPHENPGRQPKNCQQRQRVVWGSPLENPGLQPKNC